MNGLDLLEGLEALIAQFSAVTTHLVAAEGHSEVGSKGDVDKHLAALDLSDVVLGPVDVVCEKVSSQTVVGVVAEGDGLVVAGELGDTHDGTEDLLSDGGHLLVAVGNDGRLDEVAVLVGGWRDLTTGDNSASFLLGGVDEAEDLLLLGLAHGWPDVDARGELPALHERLLDVVLELGQELVVDALLHVDSRRRGTDLALVEEDAEGSPLDHLVEVGVLVDDQWRLASALQGAVLQVGLCCALLDQLADTGGAREGDLLHLRVLAQLHAGDGAETAGDVDHTGREVCLLEDLAHEQGAQRRQLGSLDHKGVTGGQAWRHLPCEGAHWEVPRNDGGAHAKRLVHRVRELGRLRLDRLAVLGPNRLAGVVSEHVRRVQHVEDGVCFPRLARLNCLQVCKLRRVLHNEVCDLVQVLRLALARDGRPLVDECVLGRIHRPVDILGAGQVHRTHRLAGPRVLHLLCLAVAGGDKLVVDEQARRELVCVSVWNADFDFERIHGIM